MTKLEYLKQLENALKGKIALDEMDDIIRDHAEYFEEGKKQGKNEDEISLNLGIPFEVAQQLLGNEEEERKKGFHPHFRPHKEPKPPREPRPTKEPRPPKQPRPTKEPRPAKEPRRAKSVWARLPLILLLLILSPVICCVFGALLFLLLSLLSVGLTLFLSGFFALVVVGVCGAVLPFSATLAGIILSMAIIVMGITGFCGTLWAATSFIKAGKRLFYRGEEEFVCPHAAYAADGCTPPQSNAQAWSTVHNCSNNQYGSEGVYQSPHREAEAEYQSPFYSKPAPEYQTLFSSKPQEPLMQAGKRIAEQESPVAANAPSMLECALQQGTVSIEEKTAMPADELPQEEIRLPNLLKKNPFSKEEEEKNA